MNEQLKQAIDSAVATGISESDNFFHNETEIKFGVALTLSTPSILRHADPKIMDKAGWMPKPKTTKEMSEMMKQAGWVREDEWIELIEKIEKRIIELNQADIHFCKDRWDLSLPLMMRQLAREESNKATFARQELQEIIKPQPPKQ